MNISDLFIEYIIMGLITVCGLITGYCIYNQIDLISFIEYHIKSSFFNTMSAGTLVTILLIYPLGMVIDNIAKFIAKPMYRSSFILQDTYYESAGYKAKDERIREAHKSQSSDRLNILKNGNENFIYQYKRQKHYTYVLRTLFVLSLMNLYVALYIMVRIINVKYEVILLLLFFFTRLNNEVPNFFIRNYLLLLDYFEIERSHIYEFDLVNNKKFKTIRAGIIFMLVMFLFIIYLEVDHLNMQGPIVSNVKVSFLMTFFTFLMYYYRTRKWFNVRQELALEIDKQ